MTHIYNIRESDIFSAALYPHVVDEVMTLKHRSLEMNTLFKEQVVISFLKSHSIASTWLESDREICKLITTGGLKISHLESLFNCAVQNQKFLEGLESYIKMQLRPKSINFISMEKTIGAKDNE